MAAEDGVVLLDEELDPSYEPSDEEVAAYARYLGFPGEGHWIAREGLTVRTTGTEISCAASLRPLRTHALAEKTMFSRTIGDCCVFLQRRRRPCPHPGRQRST